MHDVHRSAPDVGHALSIMSNTTNTAKSSPDRGMVYVVLPPRSHAPLTEVLYASLASTASSQAASQNRGSPPPVSRGRSPIRAPEKRHVSPLPRREGSTASHRTVSSDRGDPFHDTDCSSPDCPLLQKQSWREPTYSQCLGKKLETSHADAYYQTERHRPVVHSTTTAYTASSAPTIQMLPLTVSVA